MMGARGPVHFDSFKSYVVQHLELGSLIAISIYPDFVSLDGESIHLLQDLAHFKHSVELF